MDPDPTPPIVPSLQDRSQISLALPAASDAAIKRRAPIACRRCRRMRSKCVHDRKPPCDSCKAAGLGPESCVFPVRGQPDSDREYRHPRIKSEKAAKRDPSRTHAGPSDIFASAPLTHQRAYQPVKGADAWDSLPPLPDIIDAVNQFTRHYFQLGFIPKQMFTDRLRQDHRSVSVFLLLSILAISARFTPSLIERYGGGIHAAETFIERASAFALNELYQKPTLERCQGFYLLSIAQQGSGLKNSSYINLGIAMRMAALMRLHREETYALTNPTKELVIEAESARRTLWMLHSQDNLHSGPSSPVSLATSDITALLPSNEEDFKNGYEPKSRAALADTPPAMENPSLISDPGRSLFATLIQTHYFWGKISRRAVAQDKSSRPWERQSEYAQMVEKLNSWENSLPSEHLWGNYLLKGYKVEGLELAYLAVTMVTRLCNIILRKAYLHNIMYRESAEPPISRFWSEMSLELFRNVKLLYEQIDAQFKDRRPEDGTGAQIAAFCVYSCGLLAAYLCKYSNICPDPTISADGPMMLRRTMAILKESQAIWPLASRWREGLEKFAHDQKGTVSQEASMADGKDPEPHALQTAAARSPVDSAANPLDGERSAATVQADVPPHQTPTAKAANSSRSSLQPIPEMYPSDPSVRLAPLSPSTQSQQSQTLLPHQPQPHQQHQHQQHHQHQHQRLHQHQQQQQQQQQHVSQELQDTAARPAQPDGLNLLLEAFDNQDTVPVNPPPVPYSDDMPPIQPLQNLAPVMEYYGQNDGYENELQFYIEGTPNIQVWVPGVSMFGY